VPIHDEHIARRERISRNEPAYETEMGEVAASLSMRKTAFSEKRGKDSYKNVIKYCPNNNLIREQRVSDYMTQVTSRGVGD